MPSSNPRGVLLLQGREEGERAAWRISSEVDAAAEALPYVDAEYEDSEMRAEVSGGAMLS